MTSFTLKILAMLTMLIDHAGVAFGLSLPHPAYLICRVVGRLAMPLFCFLIAEGLFHTKNARKYLARLALFAIVSEVPFDRLFNGVWLEYNAQNVGFTLFLGLLGILLFDSFAASGRKAAALAAILAAGAAAVVIRSDYTCYGVFFIFVFYLFRGSNRSRTIAFAAGVLLFAVSQLLTGGDWTHAVVSLAAFAAVIPIHFYNNERGRDGAAMRVCFYAFYPIHMLVLAQLGLVLGR